MAQYTVDNCLPANTAGPPPSWPLKQSHLLDIVPIHSLKIQKRPFWLLGLNKLLKNQTLWGKKLDGRGSRFPHISKSGERMVNKYISNLIHPFRESGIELLSYSSITIPIHGTLLHPVSRANCPHGTGIKLLGNSCVGNLALFHCCCHCCQRQSTFACLLLSQLKFHWLARPLHDLRNFGGKMITFKCTRPGLRAVLVKLFLKS